VAQIPHSKRQLLGLSAHRRVAWEIDRPRHSGSGAVVHAGRSHVGACVVGTLVGVAVVGWRVGDCVGRAVGSSVGTCVG
jgi:hypothetical protein